MWHDTWGAVMTCSDIPNYLQPMLLTAVYAEVRICNSKTVRLHTWREGLPLLLATLTQLYTWLTAGTIHSMLHMHMNYNTSLAVGNSGTQTRKKHLVSPVPLNLPHFV